MGKKKRDKNKNTCYRCGGKGHFVKDCLSPMGDLNSGGRGERRRPRPPDATMKKEVSTCTMDQNPESETAESLDGPEQAYNLKFKSRSTPLEWMELLILVLHGQ